MKGVAFHEFEDTFGTERDTDSSNIDCTWFNLILLKFYCH